MISALWREPGPERSLLLRSLCIAVLLPVFLAVFLGPVAMQGWDLLKGALGIGLPIYLLLRGLYLWSQHGGGLLGRWLRELRLGVEGAPIASGATGQGVPLLTVSLVLVNVAVFASGAEPIAFAFIYAEPENWVWSTWTSLFIHADFDHLFANMFFLWVFGSALEGRVSSLKLLLFYLLAGSFANALSLVGCLATEAAGGIGASGAISGLMGLFVVRCYFARVSLGVPVLGFLGSMLPIVLRVQMNAMVLLTIFFLQDLAGARSLWEGSESNVGYWAHVGGYFFGLVAGYVAGLDRDGLREGLSLRIGRLKRDGENRCSRAVSQTLLDLEPNHVEALLSRARSGSRYRRCEAAAMDYRRVVVLLMEQRDRDRAAGVFLEYHHRYFASMPLLEQLALTPLLAARGEPDIAARCLELATGQPGADAKLLARARLCQARLLADLGLGNAAKQIYEEMIRTQPDGPGSDVAAVRLSRLLSAGALA